MKAFCLAALVIVSATASGITPSALVWEDHFASDKKHPNTLFSLLSLGTFRAELSNNFGARMKEWLRKHPHAVLRPIVTRPPVMEKGPHLKMVFVWITDGEENLNVYLVRQGCVGAGQMLAVTDEDPDIQREFGLEKDKLQVPIAEYRAVRKQLVEAEEKAKQERLGIWAKSPEQRTGD
jgi:hypothetical protein